MRILLVENYPAHVQLLRYYLEDRLRADIRVRDRLSSIEREDLEWADTIFLDLGLPDSKGVDTVNRVRQRSQKPIVVVSSSERNDAEIQEMCLKAGAVAFLDKANVVDDIVNTVVNISKLTDIPVHEPTKETLHLNSLEELKKSAARLDDQETQLADLMDRIKSLVETNSKNIKRFKGVTMSIAQALDDGLIVMDNQGEVLLINEAARNISRGDEAFMEDVKNTLMRCAIDGTDFKHEFDLFGRRITITYKAAIDIWREYGTVAAAIIHQADART